MAVKYETEMLWQLLSLQFPSVWAESWKRVGLLNNPQWLCVRVCVFTSIDFKPFKVPSLSLLFITFLSVYYLLGIHDMYSVRETDIEQIITTVPR